MDNIKHKTASRLLFVLFGSLLFLAYSNSFQVSWQLDDKPNILTNSRIQIQEISLIQLWQAATAKPGSGDLYRPVACISLGLNWFFSQNKVLGYHVVNFIVHFSTAWLLFLVIRLLLVAPRFKGQLTSVQIEFIAVLAALFWALNPVQVQAVTYIVQRMASMAGMFSILAIYLYLKARLVLVGRRTQFLFVGAGVSYIFALMSKENVVTLIFCLPLFELLFFEHNLSRDFVRKTVVVLILGCLVSLLAGMALRPELFDFVLNYYSNRPFSLTERVLTEQRILVFYLSQLFFPAPWRLSIEHDVVLSTSFFYPWTTGVAILLNLFLIVAAIRFAKKHPLFSLSVLFFYCNHIVESTILPLELVFEHRNYLPSFFMFLPLAWVLNLVFEVVKQKKIMKAVLIGCVSFLLMAEGYATYERNKAWQTEETLWLDALVKAPNSSRPLATLAIKLAWGPNPSEAKYRKALELTERTLSMRMARSLLDAAQLGNMASIHNKLGDLNASNVFYEKALVLAPNNAGIRYNYCKNLIMIGDFPKAKAELLSILEKGFFHADYFHMLGFVDLWMGQPEFGLVALQKAMQYSPGRPDILFSLGKCLAFLGHHDRAEWFYSLTRKKGRDDAVVSLSIIENLLLSEDYDRARSELKRSVNRFSLAYLFQPLTASEGKLYREVPLAREILIPYIQSELPKISSGLLPSTGESSG